MPGSAKPVSVIEDTAVAPQRLPAYIADMKKMLDGYGLSCVYHAQYRRVTPPSSFEFKGRKR